jgi:hypothetical protein
MSARSTSQVRDAIQRCSQKVDLAHRRMDLSESSEAVQEYRKTLGFIKCGMGNYMGHRSVEELLPSSNEGSRRAVAKSNRVAWVKDKCEDGSVMCNRAIISMMHLAHAHIATSSAEEWSRDVEEFVTELTEGPPKTLNETQDMCRWKCLVYRYYARIVDGDKEGTVPRYPEHLEVGPLDKKKFITGARMLDAHNIMKTILR